MIGFWMFIGVLVVFAGFPIIAAVICEIMGHRERMARIKYGKGKDEQ